MRPRVTYLHSNSRLEPFAITARGGKKKICLLDRTNIVVHNYE